MVEIGYTLSSEDHGPAELVRYAAAAEAHGFKSVWASDHYHPWLSAQGNSPFVWSVLGGVAATTRDLRIGTGVTCPTIRIHPAIIAQAAATTAVMARGRFFLGIGSGENLNEHILGDRWPPAAVRLAMLEEAVEVIRLLWRGGERSHRGTYYTVENARVWNLPDEPPPIYMSAFGPKAVELAARIADGFVGTAPLPDLLKAYREAGGRGPAIAGAKGCWAPDEATGRRRLHEQWANMGLPGEIAQELATTDHFEQAVQIVTEDQSAGSVPCGPDPEVFAASIREYAEAGYDTVFIHHVGDDQEAFLGFLAKEVGPRVS